MSARKISFWISTSFAGAAALAASAACSASNGSTASSDGSRAGSASAGAAGTASGGAGAGAGAAAGGAAASTSGASGAASAGSSGAGTSGAGQGSGGMSGAGQGGAGQGGAGQGGAGQGGNAGQAGASGGSAGSAGSAGAAGSTGVTCPTPALKSGNTTRSLVSGSNRSYVLHVPTAYAGTQAAPLIIDFHGLGGSGPGEQTSSPYPAVTDADGVVMAFPTGLAGPSGNAWNVGPCCVDGSDDVAFAKAIVKDVAGVACIDPKRVYAVGFSMGGGMSHYLACHAADVFAAVAPAAFDLLQENVTGCTPPRPITVVSFRSTADPIVPYAGGASSVVPNHPVTFLGALATFQKWAQIDGCTDSAADLGGGCQGYSQCGGGVEVELCTKQGGGHEPGNAQVAWPVLKRHTLP